MIVSPTPGVISTRSRQQSKISVIWNRIIFLLWHSLSSWFQACLWWAEGSWDQTLLKYNIIRSIRSAGLIIINFHTKIIFYPFYSHLPTKQVLPYTDQQQWWLRFLSSLFSLGSEILQHIVGKINIYSCNGAVWPDVMRINLSFMILAPCPGLHSLHCTKKLVTERMWT